MASNHQDDFMSLYLNFVSLMNVSNASRVSSKSARWMLLMEFLASFQTCSMGFLSGLYGGRWMSWTLLIQDDGVVGDDRIDGEEPGAYSLLDEKIGDLIYFHGVTSTRIPLSSSVCTLVGS